MQGLIGLVVLVVFGDLIAKSIILLGEIHVVTGAGIFEVTLRYDSPSQYRIHEHSLILVGNEVQSQAIRAAPLEQELILQHQVSPWIDVGHAPGDTAYLVVLLHIAIDLICVLFHSFKGIDDFVLVAGVLILALGVVKFIQLHSIDLDLVLVWTH